MRCTTCHAFLGDFEGEDTGFLQMRKKPEKCPVCHARTPYGYLIKMRGKQYVRLNVEKEWRR